jgi:hypothetical protein
MSIETDCSPKFQIYESNTEPHTYAVNAKFSGTTVLPQNNMIISVGSTFEAAFRRFRGFFEAKTHVAWEDRCRFARERDRLQLARSEGRSVSTKSREKFRQVNRDTPDFEVTPFHYNPPDYAPFGLDDIKMATPADAAKPLKQGPMGSSVETDQAKRQDSPQLPARDGAFNGPETAKSTGSGAAVHGSNEQTQPKLTADPGTIQSSVGSGASVLSKRARTAEEEEEEGHPRPAKMSKL